MRMMKGLLLGAVAGLASVASAQAADLPVKAKPVEYVKVCSTYGAGFFYVPGTDTCLKIGMYLRADHFFGDASASGYYISTALGNNPRNDRFDSNNWYEYRARIALSTDWRTQTDYGVLRGYAWIIAQQSQADANGNGVAGILRAFIQFAGFTVGHAVSYADFFNGADYGYLPSIWGPAGTGVNGTDLIAYTFQLGNGFSASIDIEDGGVAGTGTGPSRAKEVINANQAGALGVGAATFDNRGAVPDVVGNIRVDQAWGSAQIGFGLHDASAGYFNAAGTASGACLGAGAYAASVPSVGCGHPGDKWGWAVVGGFKLLNFLMPKDVLEFQISYAKGASSYGSVAGLYGNNVKYGKNNSVALGWITDAVFTNTGTYELTETWGFAAAYQHWWNAQWRTAVVGGYTEINYSQAASGALCGNAGTGGPNPAASTFGATLVFSNCSPSFSQVAVSTRTAWNPHPTLEIGLDLMWARINTASQGTAILPASSARPGGLYTVSDQNIWISALRFQKTILP